tara:strand:- start:4189 stop:4353 length:165 start_codon:yes stop_codon:yes gene_type:complete
MSTTLENYVNLEIGEINRLTTELYESMYDQENEEVVAITKELVKRLNHIQQSHK